MPALKTYDLFISHAWKYNEDYYRIEKFLNEAPYLVWRNYSVPVHDPLVDPNTAVGKAKLKGMIDNQIRPVNCVIILAGMYAAHSEWIDYEIEKAYATSKPILGVLPWGQERVPQKIQTYATQLVGWNTNSIVTAIRSISL